MDALGDTPALSAELSARPAPRPRRPETAGPVRRPDPRVHQERCAGIGSVHGCRRYAAGRRSRAGRRAFGIEINPRWIEIYREVCRREGIAAFPARTGDAATVLDEVSGPFDLVLTDVPYWNMDVAPRSKGRYKRVGSPARPAPPTRLDRFGAASEYADKAAWLAALQQVFVLACERLKPGGHLLSFIGDMYMGGVYHALSAELAAMLSGIEPLVWQANLIWYDVSKKLHIYGYRYRYIPSHGASERACVPQGGPHDHLRGASDCRAARARGRRLARSGRARRSCWWRATTPPCAACAGRPRRWGFRSRW